MSLPIGEIIGESWGLSKKHFRFLCLASAPTIFLILSSVAIFCLLKWVIKDPHLHEDSKLVKWAVLLLSPVPEMGLLGVSLCIVRGGTPRWDDFAAPYRKFRRLYLVDFTTRVAVSLLSYLAIFTGPFFIQSLFLAFDKDLSFAEAIEEGARRGGREWGAIWVILLLSGLIFLGGILCFGIGLLVALPLTWLIKAKIYETLRLRAEASAAVVAE